MWPFSKEQEHPPERRSIPLTADTAPDEVKLAGSSTVVFGMGSGSFMTRSAEQYAKEGYAQNGIVYACIQKIATAAASVGLQLQQGTSGTLVEKHPVLDLLKRPNPMCSGSDLIHAIIAWRLIAGEAFLTRMPLGGAKPAKGKPNQLWVLEPQKVKIHGGALGMPTSYEYASGNTTWKFPVDPISGACDLVHMRSFNPLNPTRGLSPLSAAAYSIDTHSAMLRWNKALLDNSGRPSGALVMKGKEGVPMTLGDDQYASLKLQLDATSGPAGAGRPLLLEGGLEWQEMGLNPRDMDFNKGVWMSATHIAAALGLAPQMVGIEGSQTFANFEQATLSMWEDTVLPLLESTLDTLNHWLMPMYGDNGPYLAADKDTISAMESRRQVKFDRAEKATFLTVNEKREMVDYDQVGTEGDTILVNSLTVPLDLIASDVHLSQPAASQGDGAAPADQPKPKPPADTVSGAADKA